MIITPIVINMNETCLATIVQLREFLAGSVAIEFSAPDSNDSKRYGHISRVLKRFDYPHLKRGDQGVVFA